MEKAPHKVAFRPDVISGEEMESTLDIARRAGYIVMQCGADFISHQHVAINPAVDNDLKLWWEGHAKAGHSTDNGPGMSAMLLHGAMLYSDFEYDGLYRRNGKLLATHKHLDLPPEEILPGDRVGLYEVTTDQHRHSLTVVSIDHPLNRA